MLSTRPCQSFIIVMFSWASLAGWQHRHWQYAVAVIHPPAARRKKSTTRDMVRVLRDIWHLFRQTPRDPCCRPTRKWFSRDPVQSDSGIVRGGVLVVGGRGGVGRARRRLIPRKIDDPQWSPENSWWGRLYLTDAFTTIFIGQSWDVPDPWPLAYT